MIGLIPTKIVANSMQVHTVSLSDYLPSNGWSLELVLKAPDIEVKKVIAVAEGENYKFTIPADLFSADLKTAAFCQLYAINGADRYFVESATTVIEPDMLSVAVDYDHRSHIQKVIDAMEVLIEERSADAVNNIEIGGTIPRKISFLSHQELYEFKKIYEDLQAQL